MGTFVLSVYIKRIIRRETTIKSLEKFLITHSNLFQAIQANVCTVSQLIEYNLTKWILKQLV